MSISAQHSAERELTTSVFWRRCAMAYLALVVYGSLYPFHWVRSLGGPLDWLLAWPPQRLSFTDVVVNVLAYVPLGFTLARARLQSAARARAFAFGVGIGFGASLLVETLQVYVAGRNASNVDLLTNAFGSFLGALLAVATARRGAGARVAGMREAWLAPGRPAEVVALAAGGWAAAQLFPFVPSVDVSTIWESIAPLRLFVTGQRPFSLPAAVENFLAVLAVAQLLSLKLQGRDHAWRLTALLVLAVLALKVFIVGRQLSIEMLAGVIIALATHAVLLRLGATVRAVVAMTGAVLFILVNETAVGAGTTTRSMNWIPFRAHFTNPLTGMAVMLEAAWPSVALAAALHELSPPWNRRMLAWLAGALLFGAVLALEIVQQFIPGRVPDMTTPFVYVVVWVAVWAVLLSKDKTPPSTS